MNEFFDRALSLISPHICKGCRRLGAPLCKSCFFDIVENSYEKCVVCSRDLTDEEKFRRGNLCAACAKKSLFSAAFVVGARGGILRYLVDDFKFNSERESAKAIAKLLDATIPPLEDNVVVAAVPTSRAHIRARGFDHAELIARNFAKIRHLKFARLACRTNNLTQHELDAAARRELAAKSYAPHKNYRGKMPAKILLIDDIWTTGATTEALASLFRENGAKNLAVAIVARQPAKREKMLK